jgi:hypothetical protein
MTCNNQSSDAERCPLCGKPNECQLCTAAAWKGPCWCATLEIPETLLAQVPVELRNRACICHACIESFRSVARVVPASSRRGEEAEFRITKLSKLS